MRAGGRCHRSRGARRFSSTVLAPALLAAVAGAGLGAGCGDIDAGSTPFAGTVSYVDPAGGFQIRLLEPPWIPLPLETGTIFVVPPSDATVSTDLADALDSLQIASAADSPAVAVAADIATLTLAPRAAPPRQQPVRTAAGASGVELSWQEAPATFHRDAFIPGAAAITWRLEFTAQRAIADDDMITQMIVSFAPGTAAP